MLENAYSTWKKITKKARRQIFVFTPYFDDTLVDLLQMTKAKKTVVTCIDAMHIYKNLKQIRALKKLSKQGVTIRHLSGLQAKILLIDRQYMTVGSQNFSVNNREIGGTVLIEDSGKINKYVSKTINKWIEQSKLINDFTINCLDKELNITEHRMEQQEAILQAQITEILNRTKRTVSTELSKQTIHFREVFNFEARIQFNHKLRCYVLTYRLIPEILKRNLTNKILPILNRKTGKVQFIKLNENNILLLSNSVMKQKIPAVFYQLFKGQHLGIELHGKDKLPYRKTNLVIRLIFNKYTTVFIYTGLTENGFYDIHIDSNDAKLKKLVQHQLMTFSNLPKQDIMASFFKDPKYCTTLSRDIILVDHFLNATEGVFTIKGMADRLGNMFLTIDG